MGIQSMSKTGLITNIEGNRIIVQQDCFIREGKPGEDPCFGCLKTECKTGRRIIIAENPKGLSLGKFESVEIETNPAISILQALTALGMPVLAFVTGFFLIPIIFPGSPDSARAAGGTLLMFAIAIGYYQFRRRFPVKNPFQVVGKTNIPPLA